MRLFIVAYKNLKRKLTRTILTIGGVSIAVAVLISLLGFKRGYENSLNNDIDKMGYQVLVTAKGCPYEAATLMLKGGGGMRYMEDSIYKKIVLDERIDKITPQLINVVFDPNKGDNGGSSMYMGIDTSYLELKPWTTYKEGGWFSAPDAEEVILGYEAAELEQRRVGDKVFIPGINKVLKVAGIFSRSGTQDDGVIMMPIQTAQNIFGLQNKLTGIGIKLKDMSQLKQFEEDMYDEGSIQVISMAQVKGTILNLISSAQVMVYAVALVAIIVAVVGVVNTILMSVFERTKEIGVMKAIGASRLDIFSLIWYETIIICTLGGVGGTIMAIVAGNGVEIVVKKVLPYAPEGSLVAISPDLIVFSLLGAVFLGLISGIYPAWSASSMKPIEAIRSGE